MDAWCGHPPIFRLRVSPPLSAENAERMGHPLASWPIRGEGSSGPESACLPYGFKVKGSGQECPLYTVAFVAPFEVVVIDRAACKE